MTAEEMDDERTPITALKAADRDRLSEQQEQASNQPAPSQQQGDNDTTFRDWASI